MTCVRRRDGKTDGEGDKEEATADQQTRCEPCSRAVLAEDTPRDSFALLTTLPSLRRQ